MGNVPLQPVESKKNVVAAQKILWRNRKENGIINSIVVVQRKNAAAKRLEQKSGRLTGFRKKVCNDYSG